MHFPYYGLKATATRHLQHNNGINEMTTTMLHRYQYHSNNNNNGTGGVDTLHSKIAIINNNRITMPTMKNFHTIDSHYLYHVCTMMYLFHIYYALLDGGGNAS